MKIIGLVFVIISIILTLYGILSDNVYTLMFPPILVICGAYLIIRGFEKDKRGQ